MDYKVELVAQALHQAEHGGCWDNEPIICQERFREYARNAIRLLGDDIGVWRAAGLSAKTCACSKDESI